MVDHYTWSLSRVTKLAPLFRLVLVRLAPARAYRITAALVRALFPVHYAVRNVRIAQILLSRVSPCLVYFDTSPQLTHAQHYDLTLLDTFDSLTDAFKHLRTLGQIRRRLEALGAESVDVWRGGNGVEARARKAVVSN